MFTVEREPSVRPLAVSGQLGNAGTGRSSQVGVVLAVRHEFVRRATSALLQHSEVVHLISQTDQAATAASLLAQGTVDVLVLDRQLPDGVCPASVRRMRLVAPDTGIVVVAMADDTRLVSGAIGAGASGYVLKDTADTELVEAILAVANGESYVSPRLNERLSAQARIDPRALTESHLAVLSRLASGQDDAQVARDLGLSRAEVEGCRVDIHRNLRIASRAELAQYALRHGLLGRD